MTIFGIEINRRVGCIFNTDTSITFPHNSVVAGVTRQGEVHRLHAVYSYVE